MLSRQMHGGLKQPSDLDHIGFCQLDPAIEVAKVFRPPVDRPPERAMAHLLLIWYRSGERKHDELVDLPCSLHAIAPETHLQVAVCAGSPGQQPAARQA